MTPWVPRVPAAETPQEAPAGLVAASPWQTAEEPVYRDPDDDWAKDPSVIKVGGTWYIYYTSANPWQDTGCGGKGESRIDYATSPDGLQWTYQGLSIPKGQPGEWDEERPQAPARPVLKDGVYYMYYAGKNPQRAVEIGYATSTDLRHWTKHPGNPVLNKGKDYWFYLQGTRDGGKRFQIALAKQPLSPQQQIPNIPRRRGPNDTAPTDR